VGEDAPADWFPAANPAVLAVAAVDRDGTVARGTDATGRVVLAAPGVDVLTTAPDGGYTQDSRAATAAAMVAGAAALVRAAYPDLSAAEVVHRLVATSRASNVDGYRTLDLLAALTADVPPATATPGPSAPEGAAGPPAVVRDFGPVVVVVLAVAAAAAVLGAVALLITRRSHR
jgi:subtilase family protein